MAVRIRLMRMGKIRNPQYRIVVADSRKKRDGRAIENVGLYHPKEDPSRIEVNSERVQYWLSVGAQPSEPVVAILRRTGDWQKFKGLPPPSKPVQVAAPKADRTAIYEAEAKAAAGLADAGKKDKEKPGRAEKTGKAGRAGKAEQAEGAEKPAKKAAKRAKAKADQPGSDQPGADQPGAGPGAAAAAATGQAAAGKADAPAEASGDE